MESARCSGLLLHPTSLAGGYGVGELGDAAYRFVDFLEAAGQRIWQILPLGPTGFGDSPYQVFSAFAGNPLLVSLELLRFDGLLSQQALDAAPDFGEVHVDFDAARAFHDQCLRDAHRRFRRVASSQLKAERDAFCEAQSCWLDDFTLYAALKGAHAGEAWYTWEPALVRREPEALGHWRGELGEEIDFHRFVQFAFAHQWGALKRYANAHGVLILGDIPIFVAHDSADVWANAEQFALDQQGLPTVVAGVPPDYYSATGQFWGNPLYRWERMAQDGYRWWIARFEHMLKLVDRVRLDHFRGFEAYWEILASAETAIDGRWVPGPGKPLFDAVRAACGDLPLVAEDLGLITAEVTALRRSLEVPGMAVLQFAFGGDADNTYLPHNLPRKCVLYIGTHDNDTTCGWFDGLDEVTRRHLICYLGCEGHDISWDLIRAALRSVADTVIVPVQDLLGLGSSARMNQPASATGNWRWRLRVGALGVDVAARYRELTELFGRCPTRRN